MDGVQRYGKKLFRVMDMFIILNLSCVDGFKGVGYVKNTSDFIL